MERFEDYKREVILAYEKKKKEETLPRKLANHTTANLKAECLNVFHKRYSERDSETFKSLFGERDNPEDYLKRIRAEGADKFKPLDNFLKGKVSAPKEITIELLAWFIDFESRPYRSGIPRKFNKTILAFIAAFITLTGSYIFYDISKYQCMYWNNDHYESVACDQEIQGAIIVPLNQYSLEHLKRITNWAVITRNDIGKVHYSKLNNKVEFYTTSGENPTDNRKRLLPMTEYMYEKYVLNKPLP